MCRLLNAYSRTVWLGLARDFYYVACLLFPFLEFEKEVEALKQQPKHSDSRSDDSTLIQVSYFLLAASDVFMSYKYSSVSIFHVHTASHVLATGAD